MSTGIVVLVTCASPSQAAKIGSALVRERLAACVNVVPGLTSIFSWKVDMSRERESLMIVKTRRALFEKLRRRVRALHSYETPEIVALPMAAVDPDYRRWLEKETRA
jgi:periplasmic divalent cation tolerance protein